MREATAAEFDVVFKIMQSAFPRNEYRSYNKQKELMHNSDYRIFVTEREGEICAFISIWKMDDFVYIEHFAVATPHRNRGLGKEMLDKLKELLDKRLCLEVELPLNDTAGRRIAFYERNGFFYNDYPYEQPAFSKDRAAVPLRIMSTVAPLSPLEFENIKTQIYKKVYKK